MSDLPDFITGAPARPSSGRRLYGGPTGVMAELGIDCPDGAEARSRLRQTGLWQDLEPIRDIRDPELREACWRLWIKLAGSRLQGARSDVE
jgi:hypothetical protein